MRRDNAASWVMVLAFWGLGLATARAQDDAPRKPKACEEVKKHVQYRGLAYQHSVTIRNTCDRPIACTIKASSNPEALSARVEAKQTESVVVNSGSAASEFSAEVECK